MGPAMSVSVRGTAGLPASAITAVAASAATHGWQTAITWVSGPRISSQRMRCSTYESKPKLPSRERDVARVVPVGDPHVLLGEQRAHGAAQQRGEVAGQRRDEQHLRQRGGLRRAVALPEVEQRAERRDVGRLLGDHDVAATDLDRVDAPRRTLVGEPDATEQLVPGGRGCGPARSRRASG